jgi:hypothetical protein
LRPFPEGGRSKAAWRIDRKSSVPKRTSLRQKDEWAQLRFPNRGERLYLCQMGSSVARSRRPRSTPGPSSVRLRPGYSAPCVHFAKIGPTSCSMMSKECASVGATRTFEISTVEV